MGEDLQILECGCIYKYTDEGKPLRICGYSCKSDYHHRRGKK